MTRYRILPPARGELRSASRWYQQQRDALIDSRTASFRLPRAPTVAFPSFALGAENRTGTGQRGGSIFT